MLKGQEQVVNQVDMFWDGWLSNLKTMQKFQEDIQKKALQAFSYQKEVLDFSVNALQTVEVQSLEFSKNWNDKLTSNVQQFSNQNQPLTEQLNSVHDLTEKVQALSWGPSQIVLDTVVESQNYLEETLKKTLATQQEKAAENFGKIEELVQQVKETQKAFLQPTKA